MKNIEPYKKNLKYLNSLLKECLIKGKISIAYEIAEFLFISTGNYSYLDACISIFDPNIIKKDFEYLLNPVIPESTKKYYRGIYYAKIKALDLSMAAFLKVRSKSTAKKKERAAWLQITSSMDIKKSSKNVTINEAAKNNINNIRNYLKKIDLAKVAKTRRDHYSVPAKMKSDAPLKIPSEVTEDLKEILKLLQETKIQGIKANSPEKKSSKPRKTQSTEAISQKGGTQSMKGENIWHQHEEIWRISFNNIEISIRHIIGIRILAHLLSNPHKNVDAVEIEEHYNKKKLKRRGYDQVADEQAIEDYRKRLKDLEEKLEIYISTGNVNGALKIQIEIEDIQHELNKAVDIHGRKREIGSELDKLRKRVYGNVKYAIGNIRKKHELLADHLKDHITLGNTPRYSPPADIKWNIRF